MKMLFAALALLALGSQSNAATITGESFDWKLQVVSASARPGLAKYDGGFVIRLTNPSDADVSFDLSWSGTTLGMRPDVVVSAKGRRFIGWTAEWIDLICATSVCRLVATLGEDVTGDNGAFWAEGVDTRKRFASDFTSTYVPPAIQAQSLPAAVPLPASMIMLLTALGGVGLMGRLGKFGARTFRRVAA